MYSDYTPRKLRGSAKISQTIISFFDINSAKLERLRKRNDYLLSDFNNYQLPMQTRFDYNDLGYLNVYDSTCIDIYHDGAVHYHGNANMTMKPKVHDVQKKVKKLDDDDEMRELKHLILNYTENRTFSCCQRVTVTECKSGLGCTMHQVLRREIEGKMKNEIAFYPGYNEKNKNHELCVFLNDIYDNLANNHCLQNSTFHFDQYGTNVHRWTC